MEVLRLWSLGVGSVIGGDFFGWNSCLRGGFGAGILSVVWAAVLYSLLARCVGRLCALLPKSQGSYSFVNVGLGPRYSVVVAACETVKLFWVLSALGFGIVEYFFKVVHISHSWQYGLYMFLVLCFCCLGLGGVKNLGNGQFIVTVSCLAILMFYWISAVEHFNFRKYAIPGDEWFRSWDRVLESLPFGAWFFIGFEELPLLAPHSMGAKKRAKVLWRGLLLSFFTVMSSCILTFTIASGSNPGVSTLRSEEAPLLEGMEIAYGDDSKGTTSFAVLSVLALLAPFCSFFLYCTYHLQVPSFLHLISLLPVEIISMLSQEIAEGKMIPEFISNVNHRRIPTYALVVTSITNFCLLSVFGFLFGIGKVMMTSLHVYQTQHGVPHIMLFVLFDKI